MKILIVFYSLTGNTKKIAHAILDAAGGEMLEIKTKKEIPAKGFGKYFWGIKQIMGKELPELNALNKNANDFDLIFLGTPVWGSNPVPAVRSFLAQAKLKNKKIALFCAHGGEDAGKTFIGLENELAGNEIAGKIDFKMDMVPESQLAENLRLAGEWARKIIEKK